MENKNYCWVKNETKDDIEEFIERGDAFFFQFRGQDYFIAWYDGAYQIQDPRIGEDGCSQLDLPYFDYPGHMQAKTPGEFMALPFLDGKTLFERWEELRFFD